jgi:hypothetical protein
MCQNCPIFATSLVDSKSLADCVCESGYFGRLYSNESSCSECPNIEGLYCPQNATFPSILPGFHRDPANILNAFPCFPKEACISSKGSDTICSEFYTGYLCGECIYLKSYRKGTYCRDCPSELSKILTIAAISILIIALSWKLSRDLSVIPFIVRLCFTAIQTIALFPSYFS